VIASAVYWGLEDFYAPPSEFAERWPFNGVEKVKLGMWFFLASDVMVFGAFLSAAIFIRYDAGWMSWEPLTEALPGLINTFVLITSSFTVILALVAAHRNSRKGLLASLGATILLGFTFLAIKMWEWHHEVFDRGVTLSQNAHGEPIQASVYYVTTGLHGVHVVGASDRHVPVLQGVSGPLSGRRTAGGVLRPLLALRRHRLGVHLPAVLPLLREAEPPLHLTSERVRHWSQRRG